MSFTLFCCADSKQTAFVLPSYKDGVCLHEVYHHDSIQIFLSFSSPMYWMFTRSNVQTLLFLFFSLFFLSQCVVRKGIQMNKYRAQ